MADIRGDLHSHTVASDGRGTITEMAEAARERGYKYLAVTDHSATHGFGNHVTPDELKRQIERVAKVNEKIEGITVLAGTETNVLPDGTVDYEDDLLAQLDWVVASVHTSFNMREENMTARVITALEHPQVDVLGHPTGRLIGRREPYALDLDAVIEAAVRTGTFLEINANPNRRDLNESYAREAAAAGVKLVIDSDAHGTETLANMRYGVATARRAWLTKDDVANTRTWAAAQETACQEIGIGPISRTSTNRASAWARLARPRRADQLGRAERRALVQVEADAVAVLDGLHGGRLAPPGERHRQRVARRDGRGLGHQERETAR